MPVHRPIAIAFVTVVTFAMVIILAPVLAIIDSVFLTLLPRESESPLTARTFAALAAIRDLRTSRGRSRSRNKRGMLKSLPLRGARAQPIRPTETVITRCRNGTTSPPSVDGAACHCTAGPLHIRSRPLCADSRPRRHFSPMRTFHIGMAISVLLWISSWRVEAQVSLERRMNSARLLLRRELPSVPK